MNFIGFGVPFREKAENNQVIDLLKPTKDVSYWLGVNDLKKPGEFVDTLGKKVSWFDWRQKAVFGGGWCYYIESKYFNRKMYKENNIVLCNFL